MPFGLPATVPDPGPLVGTLQDSDGSLSVVVSALTDSLASDLSNADAVIESLSATIRRSLAGRLSHADQQLGDIFTGLSTDLTSVDSITASLMASLQQAIQESDDRANPDQSPPVTPLPFAPPLVSPAISPPPLPPPAPPNPWDVVRESLSDGRDTVQIATATLAMPERPDTLVYTDDDEESRVDAILAAAPGWAGVPVALTNGIPPPGSVEFCRELPNIVAIFERIGDTVALFVEPLTETQKVIDYLRGKKPVSGGHTVFESLTDAIFDVLIWLAETAKPAWEWVGGIVRAAWHWQQTMTLRYSPKALIGITALESVMHSIQRFRLGTDFAAWATADIGVVLPILQQILDAVKTYLAPLRFPVASEATTSWLQGRIGEGLRDCVWRLNGLDPETYLPYALSSSQRIDARAAVQQARRNGYADGSDADALRARGWVDEGEVAAYLDQYDAPPTQEQILSWLRAGTLSPELVARFGLDTDYAQTYQAEWQTLLRSQGITDPVARANYLASQRLPSVDSLREFIYRCRPGKPDTTLPCTSEHLDALLRGQQYSTQYADWVRQTLYRVEPESLVRSEYARGKATIDDVQSHYADTGYSDAVSARLASATAVDVSRAVAASSGGWTVSAISAAWTARLINPGQVRILMRDLAYTNEQADTMMQVADARFKESVYRRARSRLLSTVVVTVRAAMSAGVMDTTQAASALADAGWPTAQAAGIASIEDANAKIAQIAAGSRAVRSAFLAGEITLEYASQQLQQLGLVPQSLQRTLVSWQVQQTPRRKRRTATQIVTDLSLARISAGDAYTRLTNLGYDDADARLYLADAQSKVIRLHESELAAAAKSGEKRQKALDSLVKAAEKAKKDAISALEKESPVSQMQKWAKLGLIDHDTFRQRLTTYGYDDADAERWWLASSPAKRS